MPRRPTDTRIEIMVSLQELEQVTLKAQSRKLTVPNYLRLKLGLPLREHRGFENHQPKKRRKAKAQP